MKGENVSSEQQAAEVLARALCDCAGPFEAGVQHEPYCASGHARHAIAALPDDRREAVVDALNGGEEPRFYSADYEAVGAERERDALALQVEALRGALDALLAPNPGKNVGERYNIQAEREDNARFLLQATPATAADVKARLLEPWREALARLINEHRELIDQHYADLPYPDRLRFREDAVRDYIRLLADTEAERHGWVDTIEGVPVNGSGTRVALALQVEALRGALTDAENELLGHHDCPRVAYVEDALAIIRRALAFQASDGALRGDDPPAADRLPPSDAATAADVKARLLPLVVEVDRIEQLSVNGCVWGCDGPLEPPCDVHRLVNAARALLTDTEDWCNNPDHTHPPGECPDFIDH